MKRLFLFAALFAATFVSAQVSKDLGSFSAVRVFDQIDVMLIKSSENRIEIKGSKANDVEVVTKNDELKIRMKLSKLLQGEDISVTLYYNGNINKVEASEGARIASNDTFTATAFELNAKEGAEIKLNLEVKNLDSKANSGGILNITGKADNHDLTITSGGIFNGRELVTLQTEVRVNAGGEAEVNATEYVDAKTNAGGDIDIYGNPGQVDQKTFAGGNIDIHR